MGERHHLSAPALTFEHYHQEYEMGMNLHHHATRHVMFVQRLRGAQTHAFTRGRDRPLPLTLALAHQSWLLVSTGLVARIQASLTERRSTFANSS